MGQNKAFLDLGGRPLISKVVERMAQICSDVLIVASNTRQYERLSLPVIPDIFRNVGVLGGLHAGLAAAAHDLALVVACDMPFLNTTLLTAFAGWAEGFDVVILRQGNNVEPLHAAYRKTCLPAIEHAIHAGQHRVISFFPQVHTRYVTPADIMPIDPALSSFRNVNTPKEWKEAQATWGQCG